MATKSIAWPSGTGSITVEYDGSGNGTIQVSSDPNNLYENRSTQITVHTTDGSNISRTVTIAQAAKVRIDISSSTVSASNQTYSGSAKTPTPTVTLNGSTIPSSGYDVSYSNNTNAGTATITVTGKGEYTGTVTGTFTINQATGQVTTAPTARSVTYTGSSQYLVTAGSGTGTMYYRYKLSTGSSWSSWSTSRPSRTNAGTYNIEYYAAASSDGNYTQSATGSLNVTMAKASRTLSFADSYVVINTSSNVTKTATPSAGSSDGAITYSISSTTYATINSSSGKVTSKSSDGSAVVTATIAEGTNYLSASASYNLYVFATTHNYDYNGSYRSVTLPPGTYQFQCWGAQGGSNGTNSSYGIIAKAGGKGGYSEGIITLSQKTTVRVYVGGQGSSSSGGYNGGGSTTGTSQHDADGIFGYSKMGGGGGATDIRLSDGTLLSRMIVAGGGGGGAMCYQKTTTTTTITDATATSIVAGTARFFDGVQLTTGRTYKLTITNWPSSATSLVWKFTETNDIYAANVAYTTINRGTTSATLYVPSNGCYMFGWFQGGSSYSGFTITVSHEETSTSSSTVSNTGGYGGGTQSGADSNNCKANQTAAGNEGGFGYGANQESTNYRFASGAGGGGWYGGGRLRTDAVGSIYYAKAAGGGSGFVNVAASAGNRPSGYNGLQLDTGETKDGSQTFKAPSGSNETGHSGNGYARITRLN